jgi:hypothetical protein
VELYLNFPVCIHGKYKDNLTFLCQWGRRRRSVPSYAIMGKEEALRTPVIRVKLLSTLFISNLCSLLIETAALLAPRGHGLLSFGTNEHRRSKNCESETGKASYCTKWSYFSRRMPVTSLPGQQIIFVLFKNYWNYHIFVWNLRTGELPFKISSY